MKRKTDESRDTIIYNPQCSDTCADAAQVQMQELVCQNAKVRGMIKLELLNYNFLNL